MGEDYVELVKKLNEEIDRQMIDGITVNIVYETDGINKKITFLGITVWNSYDYDEGNVEQQVRNEINELIDNLELINL